MTRAHAPHFFVQGWGPNKQAAITGSDAHHLLNVRRARQGDLVHISDGAGRVADARIASISDGNVVADIGDERVVAPNRPRVILFQGLAKGTKPEMAIQKLVELGADEIAIFSSLRTVPDWDEGRGLEALARWSSIALEAAKQSRRGWLPEVVGPLSTTDAAARLGMCEAAFVADSEAPVRLGEALPGLEAGTVGAAVGPEGGLTDEEIRAFVAQGAQAVSLGDQILRSETASLALATILMFHFRLLG